MGSAWVSQADIHELDFNVNLCPPDTPSSATISISVVDGQSGVASVTASWTTSQGSSTVGMNDVGGSYQTIFGPFNYPTVPDSSSESIAILLNATDAAGNESKKLLSVTVHSLGECLI